MATFPLSWLLALSLSSQDAVPPPALELLDHARLAAELEALAAAHPGVARLETLGTSRGGRALVALRLAGKGAESEPARPAILLVANVEGPRVYASAVALHHARALAAGYGTDERVTALLDGATVFVVPRANPDAAEARFETPRMERRASGPGVDDDRDGRGGEDPPADVDGDGVVTWIRVEDPDGRHRADPTDPRALVEADRAKGERAVYRLWPEGRDADGDELVAEDAALDARVDRNFPAGWEAHAADAGLFPTDEPETQALCELVLAHPELALVVLYDGEDTLVRELKGIGDDAPRVKRIPPEGVLESDAKLLQELGKRYRAATECKAEGARGESGAFGRWCYEHRGLPVLATPLWDLPLDEKKAGDGAKDGPEEKGAEGEEERAQAEETGKDEQPREPLGEERPDEGGEAREEAPAERGGRGQRGEAKEKGGKGKDDEPKPSDDAKRLRWIDARGAEEAWRFLPWRAFQHPELGAVEIGGLAPYARLEPPASESGAIAAAHLAWFLGLGELVARVRIAECTRERLGQGLSRVTVVLQNDGFLPLQTRSARRTETQRPAKVRLVLPDGATRVAGPAHAFVDDLPGSGGRQELVWLVAAPDAAEISAVVESPNAGTATATAVEEAK